MSTLTFIEKKNLEFLLGMGSGYVADFSNRTFQEFVADSVGIDIMDSKYDLGSGSKANRLRAFWNIEEDFTVGLLTEALLAYLKTIPKNLLIPNSSESDEALIAECEKIAVRLKQGGTVENIDALQANTNDKDFNLLAKSIRDSIDKNEPEVAIDRLHTFVVKYVRQLCQKYSIPFGKDTPLHSLFGGYVKHLTQSGLIESDMSIRILKSSISVMEAFNDVRNNQSLAHDNPILNYHESVLIFNDVANVIRFIESIEKQNDTQESSSKSTEIDLNDLPF